MCFVVGSKDDHEEDGVDEDNGGAIEEVGGEIEGLVVENGLY